MGRVYVQQIDACRYYGCKCCATPLSTPEQIISKVRSSERRRPYRKLMLVQDFHGTTGRAYLFDAAYATDCILIPWLILRSTNVALGPEEERGLRTGLHVVCDVFCNVCGAALGWYYVRTMFFYFYHFQCFSSSGGCA